MNCLVNIIFQSTTSCCFALVSPKNLMTLPLGIETHLRIQAGALSQRKDTNDFLSQGKSTALREACMLRISG